MNQPATPQDDLAPRPVGRYEWEALLRRAELPKDIKYVGLLLATFADSDGSRVRPGEAELALAAGEGASTVRKRVKVLRELGLIALVARGGGRGGKFKASVYRLTMPLDLLDRVELRAPKGVARAGVATVSPLTQGSGQSEDSALAQGSAQSGPSPVDNSESALTLASAQSPDATPNDRSNNTVSDLMSAQISRLSARAERATTGHNTDHLDRPTNPDPTQPTTPPPPAELKPARCPHGLPAHIRNGQPACPICRRGLPADGSDPP